MITITFTDEERGLTKSYQMESLDDLIDPTKLSLLEKGKHIKTPIVYMVHLTKKYMERENG